MLRFHSYLARNFFGFIGRFQYDLLITGLIFWVALYKCAVGVAGGEDCGWARRGSASVGRWLRLMSAHYTRTCHRRQYWTKRLRASHHAWHTRGILVIVRLLTTHYCCHLPPISCPMLLVAAYGYYWLSVNRALYTVRILSVSFSPSANNLGTNKAQKLTVLSTLHLISNSQMLYTAHQSLSVVSNCMLLMHSIVVRSSMNVCESVFRFSHCVDKLFASSR